jgi:hypothetical protein
LALPANNDSVDLHSPVSSSMSPLASISLLPSSSPFLRHFQHTQLSGEVPLLRVLSSGIYQVYALFATPKAKDFVHTLVAMDTCCGLDLFRQDMVSKDAIRQHISEAPRVRGANGRLIDLSAMVCLEVCIADQVFERTLFVAPQLSV